VNSAFKFLNFSDNHKILLSPGGLFYMVAVLLTNAHTILHGSQTSQYFACPPPSLHNYFHGERIDDVAMDSWCNDAPWVDIEIAPDEEDVDDEGGM
jgi:hypothetical protein